MPVKQFNFNLFKKKLLLNVWLSNISFNGSKPECFSEVASLSRNGQKYFRNESSVKFLKLETFLSLAPIYLENNGLQAKN
jgi:hypothetical protein